jgi:hypothetical protein
MTASAAPLIDPNARPDIIEKVAARHWSAMRSSQKKGSAHPSRKLDIMEIYVYGGINAQQSTK